MARRLGDALALPRVREAQHGAEEAARQQFRFRVATLVEPASGSQPFQGFQAHRFMDFWLILRNQGPLVCCPPTFPSEVSPRIRLQLDGG